MSLWWWLDSGAKAGKNNACCMPAIEGGADHSPPLRVTGKELWRTIQLPYTDKDVRQETFHRT
jgi:hypothetical protein